MTIRQVMQHPKTGKWAYVEYNSGSKIESIMGDKEFDTEEEATEYSKGFDLFSYTWKDPNDPKRIELLAEKESLENRVKQIDRELNK